MSENDQESKIATEHLAARNDVISEYGTLWRQAIEKAGVTDEVAIAHILQVCAACYLDGVHQGSRVTIEQLANGK